MNKLQWIVAGSAALLFLALWLGFDTKNASQRTTDRSSSIQGETTAFSTLLSDAKEHLPTSGTQQVAELERAGANASDANAKSEAYKALSGFWYRNGNIPVAGGYADSVAIVEQSDAAWSVAGGTYFNGLLNAGDNQLIRQYCGTKAIAAFENAASLSPQEAEHQVNLALVYAEFPPADNPMKAVLMLRDLETKYPTEPAVFNALGRLAIKTNQWDRAIQRLEKAWSLDATNPTTPCLLAKAYEGAGNAEKAKEFAQKCK